MRSFSIVLAVLAGLVGCLSTSAISSSTGLAIGSSSGGASSVAGRTSGASSSGGLLGTTTGGTTGTTGGGPCVTAADCGSSGDICLDGGLCGPLEMAPSLSCVPVGDSCTPGAVCCQGTCGAGQFCTAWNACGLLAQQCQTTTDCCWNESCDAGTCTPACGNLATACTRDSDCCGALGLVCRPPSVPTGNPMECVGEKSTNGTSCTPQKSPTSAQCNLGVACKIAGGVDPCLPAGFICDPFYGVCRLPYEYELCLPGGPACQGIANSVVGGLQCIERPERGYAECLQPCRETSDCIGITQSCGDVSGQGSACFGNYGCTDYFDACSAEISGDGTCVPVQTSTGIEGECYQSAADAGVACDHSGNRENGGLCAAGQRCIAGLCTELCNAGTSGIGPSCSSGSCLALNGTSDPDDEGLCEQSCDFTDPDGGGCPSTADVPEKCIAAFQDGFPDLGNGFCELAVTNPPALGQPCSQQDPLHEDSCGPGQACAAQNGGSRVICVQLCKNPGTKSNCPAGQTCKTWYNGGVASTVMGSCG